MRLLIVDDDALDREATRRALVRARFEAEVVEVDDFAGGLHALVDGNFDCAIMDHHLPGGDGLELLRAARAAGVDTPVVMLTGQGDEELAVSLMKGGAADYLAKPLPAPERLAQSVTNAVRVAHLERAAVEARRRLEQQAADLTRAVRARDEVLAIVSHDLRSPLSTIGLAVDQLVDPELDTAARERYAAAVRRAVTRADRLISDLLDVNRLEGGQVTMDPRPIAVAPVLRQVARDHEVLARAAGIAISVHAAEELVARADRDRLLQALGNLVGNALHHARGCGAVEIGAERDPEGRVRMWVQDRGPGIPAAELPHVFDRYFQGDRRRRGGAGLGLAIARAIVEGHGGRIAALSEPGAGARFEITLPAV
jgi:signal transduction histidine kinase